MSAKQCGCDPYIPYYPSPWPQPEPVFQVPMPTGVSGRLDSIEQKLARIEDALRELRAAPSTQPGGAA